MRVLVCGSREWGVGEMETDPWRPEAPQCDPTTDQYKLVANTLEGLVGGTQPWMTTLIEGAAPGADSCAWHWLEDHNKTINQWGGVIGDTVQGIGHEHFPALWFDEHGDFRRWAGPERNKVMLEEGKPDVVYAFTNDIVNSRGTRNMCEISKAAGIPVYVIGEFNG